MRHRDRFDALTAALAAIGDATAIFAGFMLAVWIRFYSGWIHLRFDRLPPLEMYWYGSGIATLLFLFIFRSLGLYVRPQYGHFTDKIPRLVRACGLGILLALALAFAIRTQQPFSRIATGLAFFTVTLLVLVERNILHQLERHWAKYRADKRNVIIIGTGSLAARLKRTLEGEPRRRARIVAFLRSGAETPDAAIPPDLIQGDLADLPRRLEAGDIDEVIMATPTSLPHEPLMETILQCERNLADFHLVPDIFRLLTSRVDMQTIDGIPLLGVGRWPLDFFWNRMLKRTEDLVGSAVGLVLSAPLIAAAALLVKLGSPGPVFYRQERCGEKGRPFNIYKLRTMVEGAEAETGPVWATPNDPRRTRVGAFLRRFNIDELPQFWNVITGDMSLVGPRPERPHFVEQFKDDISRYMWRHTYRPGMTGLAQVNGLRGNTPISERIKHDLYYLENWSLALDFKILALTFLRRENAY
jgi:exopolysaccharide biosynthesis polyprenyl glycosylphosphotransferase